MSTNTMGSPTEPSQRDALEAFLALFGSLKQAMRVQLQADGGADWTPMHLRMLQLCQRHPGITQQGLTGLSGRDKGQVARLVKDLLDQGLLSREAHPDDRRSHRLRPSPAGEAACAQFERMQAAVAAQVFGGLTAAELAAFTGQLEALRERLAPMARTVRTAGTARTAG